MNKKVVGVNHIGSILECVKTELNAQNKCSSCIWYSSAKKCSDCIDFNKHEKEEKI